MKDRYSSRKFWLSVLIYIGTAGLAAFGKIDGNAYSLTTAAVIGAYIAGNVKQKQVEAVPGVTQ